MSKNRNLPENIIKIKNLFESGNNLIDYFLLCGCEPYKLLKEKKIFNLSEDKDKNLNTLSELIKPKILSKFPEFDNCNNVINDEILSYCCPYGFQPYYDDSGNKINEYSFSVILDNNIFSSEFPQKYMTCLLFYENLEQYKNLFDEIFGNENISSINPEIINKLKYYFIPKSLVIISKYPYTSIFPEILSSIYNYSLSNEHQIPIEKIITNLVIEVPMAPRGLSYIDFTLINTDITLKRTDNNKMLLTDIDLRNFYGLLSLDNQIEVLKHLLYGSKIIIFSENINNITETMISFLFILFPFKYPFYITSLLNKNNYNIIESVSPFFVGINEAYNPEFFNDNDINIEGIDFLIVDLDNNSAQFVSSSSETIPDFPSRLITNLIKSIKTIENKYLKGENAQDDQDNEEEEEEEEDENENDIDKFNKIYQKTFLIFICDIIKNYQQFLNVQYLKTTKDAKAYIENIFKCEEFINCRQNIEFPFYNKLVYESKLFNDLIYKLMIPKNNQDFVDNLLIYNTMTKIKNKTNFFEKASTIFEECIEYVKKDRYSVPKVKELNEKEKIFIKNNIEKLNKKGQIISENSSNDISFKYIIFPQLDFDIYFNNENSNEYHSPPNFLEKIESINTDIISKSPFGQNSNRSVEMTNYLYLTWLEIWAFTFSYIDEKERQYRFNQLIDVLNKVFHHDMDILNLIFDTLHRNSQNEMILKLYQKLIILKITPTFFICNIVSSAIDKEQLRELNNNLQIASNKLIVDSNIKYKNCKKVKSLRRTFSSVEDNLEINKTLKIYSNFSCIKCKEKINLANVCKNFTDIKNDILWVMCKCGQYNLPKITIKYGKELLRDNVYKTSYSDEIILYLPINLKNNIKSTIMENFGTDLNVSEFRSQYKPLFWNFFWYCKIHQLDYEILLPYLNDVNELRNIKYKSRAKEIFEVVYEDKYYEENMKQIDKYSKNIYERFINKTIKKKTIFKNLNEIKKIKLKYIPGNEIEEEYNELNKEVINNEEENENKINEEENNIENNNEENNIENKDVNESEVEEEGEGEGEQNIENEENNKEQEIAEEKEGEVEGVEQEGEAEGQVENEGEAEGEVENEENNDNQKVENQELAEVEVENQDEQVKEVEVENHEEMKEEDIERNEEEKEVEEKNEEEQNIEANIEQSENIEQNDNIEQEEINEIKQEEINEIKQEEVNEIHEEEEMNQEQIDNNIEQNKNPEINEQNEEEPKEEECIVPEEEKKKKNIQEDIKSSIINIELKKIKESTNPQMFNINEINVDLKKIDGSVFKKEPEIKKSINCKLKKVDEENLSHSTISINSGEELIAKLKKKLKKVGSTGV